MGETRETATVVTAVCVRLLPGLSGPFGRLQFLIVSTTCDRCLITKSSEDPLVPFFGCVARLMIEVNGTTGKHHNLLCDLVLEENIKEFAYTVRAPKPHDAKWDIRDSIDQACPKGGWIHVMHLEEPCDGLVSCHLSLLAATVCAYSQGTLLLVASKVW